ncbi:MAG: response regulator, partial [Desulfobacteraceae bacterium]|nr:response regulator [Desulfobacteraceae bacterium]
AGYDILVAKDGVEVLAAVETNGPLDLLVLDLEVPDADSPKILEKAQTRRPPLPVVIHTFLTEESERDMPDAAEIFIEKNGNIDHLKSAIAEILKRFYPERS